jgi:putative FmdB family regulatory protein
MPSYDFACPDGHVTELVQKMSDPLSETTDCGTCDLRATRVFAPPAAVHFKGSGFYSTDVKGRQERKRRPNAADDLYRGHDDQAAAIARSL